MRLQVALLAVAAGFSRAAVDINGVRVTGPLDPSDPAPIDDGSTYHPDSHDCPVPCSGSTADLANIHSWIAYPSLTRLERCNAPMLVKLSLLQSLDGGNTNVLVRSCALGTGTGGLSARAMSGTGVEITLPLPMAENPKRAANLAMSSLDTALACRAAAAGGATSVREKFQLIAGRVSTGGAETAVLLDGMRAYFEAADNCDETVVFAYDGKSKAVAGLYVGAGLGKATVKAALDAFRGAGGSGVAQLCGADRSADRIVGIAVDTSGDMAAVHRMATNWAQGVCVGGPVAPGGTQVAAATAGTVDIDVVDLIGGLTPSNSTITMNGTVAANSTLWSRSRILRPHGSSSRLISGLGRGLLAKRATCRYIKVASGDGCDTLLKRCGGGLTAQDFYKYNPKPNLCSTLKPDDYVCCSAGDPYKPPKVEPPKPNADGTCATHLIVADDTCARLATKYGVTVEDLEAWNKGRTWAWTDCRGMLLGYNMCVSKGNPPLPPPQAGTECGPIVPGTKPPSSPNANLADLNPCPLKACCSNWGYCGVFPAHCDKHAPPGGGPGSKLKEFNSTCVSNCGTDIKQNSGPPSSFGRIGYYESWNLERDCLWLKAEHANTDGSYTHIHWGFAEIDPKTWNVVLVDKKNQWPAFKGLKGVKRIVSFGGWAYSTEAATYNILRQAIIDNYETFSTSLADFVNKEGLDGVDIDWEYPGAPDIMVNGKVIGQKGDGAAYLRFLQRLKSKVGSGKSVSIAAPASYWYLKAFPIDQIAKTIDYIVYMTYDLHGQWDWGQPNSFDQCDSGKCIRSHINLTETRNTLSIITKADVPNNKIFVGEASYGRSFRMARDGCWGPMCEFTGTRTRSDANPGRCTKTPGYLAYAEITEILARADGVTSFHDGASNTDVILYKGDYVSYMTPTTKDTRRNDWKALNFAGTIDWAVDLQSFTHDDMNLAPDRPKSGEACVLGRERTLNSAQLCAFSCELGFCPDTLCICRERGELNPLPPVKSNQSFVAIDALDVDMNRLCKFACKYGYCPSDVCEPEPVDNDQGIETFEDPRLVNRLNCLIYKDPSYRQYTMNQCYNACKNEVEAAKAEGRTTSYGCVGFFPLDQDLPWDKKWSGTGDVAIPGKCSCDNWFVNTLADTILDAMPAIAQIGCFLVMSTLKLVVELGAEFIPGVGKIIDAGLDMAAVAAQTAAYFYPESEDPLGAFDFWLSPCGGSDLVPEDLKKAFDILSNVADGVSSFEPPKKLGKGKGKKGDAGNPRGRGNGNNGSGKGNGNNNGNNNSGNKKNPCRIRPGQSTYRLNPADVGNTLRVQSCRGDSTVRTEYIITSLVYAPNAARLPIKSKCKKEWEQACYHYSSAVRVNSQWATITCNVEAATTQHRLEGLATDVWARQHEGTGWRDKQYRQHQGQCDRDEYPPAHLLGRSDLAWQRSGLDAEEGQLVRLIPSKMNQEAGKAWWGACFDPAVAKITDNNVFRRMVEGAPQNLRRTAHDRTAKPGKHVTDITRTFAAVTVAYRPEWSFEWEHTAPLDDGLWDNGCWPQLAVPDDPRFALLDFDAAYNYGQEPTRWRYDQPYVPGQNGFQP